MPKGYMVEEPDAGEFRVLRLREKWTYPQLAHYYEVEVGVIKRWAAKFCGQRVIPKPTPEQIKTWFLAEGLTNEEVIAAQGVSGTTVKKWKREAGVDTEYVPPFTEAELRDLYKAQGLSDGKIARLYAQTGIASTTVGRYRTRWGIEALSRGERRTRELVARHGSLEAVGPYEGDPGDVITEVHLEDLISGAIDFIELSVATRIPTPIIRDHLESLGYGRLFESPESLPKSLILTSDQWDLVNGTLLGDGSLPAGSGILSWTHGDSQRGYLRAKLRVLGELASANFHRYWRVDSRVSRGGYWAVGGYTRSHRFWRELWTRWYPGGGDKIPPEEVITNLTPGVLAYWAGDDSMVMGDSPALCTHGFSRDVVDRLASALRTQYDLKVEVYRQTPTSGFYLKFVRDSKWDFWSLIAPVYRTFPDVQDKWIDPGGLSSRF